LTPLVLVHGFMGGRDQWHLQDDLGAAAPLIKIALPGFGDLAHLPPISSIGGFADWVLAELSRQEVEQFHLLGHSMGGMIVQEMVRKAPARVKGLVLYGTGPVGLLPDRFEPIGTSMRRATKDGPRMTARRISATWFLSGERASEYPGCAAIAETATLPAILAGLEAMRDWSGEANLGAISSPTLVLWGDGDRTYSWVQIEKLWRGIANSRLAVVPNCAHAVHLEEPQIFNSLVAGFLNRAGD